jgi:CPA1 family monovalent cation:H+ antiporter
LLAAVTVLCWLSSRIRLPYPIVLVLAGLLIAFIPSVPHVHLDPEVVFLLFMPPLLYRAATTTDWTQFRLAIPTISMLAIGLVFVTILLVGLVAHTVIGLSWPLAFLLGAIISPTDALAATVVMRRLRVPPRLAAIVEGESLVNDAGALVAYGLALSAILTGSFSFLEAGTGLVVDAIGGVAMGIAVAWFALRIRPRISEAPLRQALSLLVPFAAYIPAHALGLSGVLAVVACGLMVGTMPGGLRRPEAQLNVVPMWQAVEFMLNGLGFILIGLQLPFVLEGLSSRPMSSLIGWAVLIALTTIGVRALWMFAAMLVRRPGNHGESARRRLGAPQALILSWSGMRGLISLAAALAIPHLAQSQPFPERHLIIFLTFGVILITLIGQGLTLPLVIRLLRLDGRAGQDEETIARYAMTHAALNQIDQIGRRGGVPAGIVKSVERRYGELLSQLERAVKEHDQYFASQQAGEYLAVRREVIAAMRQRLRELNDHGLVDPEICSRLGWELDIEESTLSGFDLPADDPEQQSRPDAAS